MQKLEENTEKVFIKKGLILDSDSVDSQEKERLVLLDRVKDLGIKVHPRTGIEKLNIIIDDRKALDDLKDQALSLGIDPSDDVTFDQLKILVDDKKNESDS